MEARILDKRRLELSERLAQVSSPISLPGKAILSVNAARAQGLVEQLRDSIEQSHHVYVVAGIIEGILGILQAPQDFFAGVYRFNALQCCDSLEDRLAVSELNKKPLDSDHREDFFQFLSWARKTLGDISRGDEQNVATSFQHMVDAALRIRL